MTSDGELQRRDKCPSTGAHDGAGGGSAAPVSYSWSSDASLKIAVILLPLLYSLWLWSPFMSRTMLLLSAALLLAVPCVVRWLGGKQTVTLDAEGVHSSGFWQYTIPWDQVVAVRRHKALGIVWPSLALDLDERVDIGRFVTKETKTLRLNVMSISTLRLYGAITQFVDDDRIDPDLEAFSRRHPSALFIGTLAAMHLPMTAAWLAAIFVSTQLAGLAHWRILLKMMVAILVVGFIRQVMYAFLRWYEPENLLLEVRNGVVTLSLYLLLPLMLSLRSDPLYVVSAYTVMWLFVSLEVVGLLFVLRYRWRLICPYWGFVVLAGFLAFPGPQLLWEFRHVRTVVVVEKEPLQERDGDTVFSG